MLQEALDFADELAILGKQKSTSGVAMENLFGAPTVNCIWSMIAGTRFSEDDPKFRVLGTATRRMQDSLFDSPLTLFLFPPIRFIAPESSGYKPMVEFVECFWTFMKVSVFFFLQRYYFFLEVS